MLLHYLQIILPESEFKKLGIQIEEDLNDLVNIFDVPEIKVT